MFICVYPYRAWEMTDVDDVNLDELMLLSSLKIPEDAIPIRRNSFQFSPIEVKLKRKIVAYTILAEYIQCIVKPGLGYF